MQNILNWTLGNPAFVLYVIAILAIIIRLWGRQQTGEVRPRVDISLAYMLLIAVGFNGLYNFVMHAFYGSTIAAFMGWAQSPFQAEVAMANLALGVLGCLAFRADYGFRLATVIAIVIFEVGAALVQFIHYYPQINQLPANIGSVVCANLLISFTVLLLTYRYRKLMHVHALEKDRYI